MAARGVEMSKALPEYSPANGGLEKRKMGSREKELGRGGVVAVKREDWAWRRK